MADALPETSISATVTEFPLAGTPAYDDAVVVPTVKGIPFLKYGKHAYYFYNFRLQKCLCVEVSHRDIITPGLPLFLEALEAGSGLLAKAALFFRRFHYGFGLLEQVMLMTVPHAVTAMGNGKFLINLWSYVGYLEIDCRTKEVRYLRRDRQDHAEVLGSQQWFDHDRSDIYYMAYSLPESLRKTSDPYRPVPCKVLKQNLISGAVTEIWGGPLTDYLHDILVDRTGRYCVVCELGMFQDGENKTIPSKVLIIDMRNGRDWVLSRFIVAAHAQFDPSESDVVYFSNHNFKFVPSSIVTLLRNAIYSLEFTGPASVHKYRLTPDGPEELGVFTDPAMFRLTNFHVFIHRGRKLLAAMGFPNFIYLADAETMKGLRRITLENPEPPTRSVRKPPCFIGTFSPSADGERLYVQTTRSFQVVDVESGGPITNTPLAFNHTAANHMQTTHDTAW